MENTQINRFTGINNRQPIDRIKPTDAGMPVRDAVNVDLSASGTFQRRPGFSQVVSLSNCRDIFEVKDGALFAAGDRLYRFDGQSASDLATLASPHVRVAYTETPLGTVWSDGFTLNLAEATSMRLTPARPNPEPSAAGVAGGSLVAGTYGLMFASLRSDGMQSAPTVPVFVSVPANGAIQIAASGHASRIIVYVTGVDGSVFYREAVIEVGQTSLTVPFVASAGQPLQRDIISDLPPGRMLAMHRGRLLSADGAFLFYSLPWALGLYRPAYDFITLDEDITLVKPVEGGVYVATTSATYFLAGGDISKADPTKIAPYGAIKGTAAKLPNSLDLMWHTPRGPVTASQDGNLALMQDAQIAYPSASAGASILRESNGLRQFITALSQAQPSGGAVFGSFMDARVITGA